MAIKSMQRHHLLFIGSAQLGHNVVQDVSTEPLMVTVCLDVDQAVASALANPPNIVLCALRHNGQDGGEILRRVRAAAPAAVRLLLCEPQDVEMALEREERGDVFRHMTIPWHPLELRLAVRKALERALLLGAYHKETARVEEESTKNEAEDIVSVANELARLLGERESWLAAHGLRVAAASLALGRALELVDNDLRILAASALLHDYGKISWPDDMLRRFDIGTEADHVARYRRHPEVGERVLRGIPALRSSAPAVRHHHERWDGQGFPARLAGDDIPLHARIIAVADQFERIAFPRYRGSGGLTQGCAAITQESRTALDPALVRTFLLDVATQAGLIADMEVAALQDETVAARARYLLSPHFYHQDSPKKPAPRTGPVHVTLPITRVHPGLTLARNVMTVDGAILLVEGRRLDQHLIARLEEMALAGVIAPDIAVRH